MKYLYLLTISVLWSSILSSESTVSISVDKYDELRDKANKWDKAEKEKEEEAAKIPEAPKRSDLKINLINDTGLKAYIKTKVRVVEKPFQFMELQGSATEQTVTLGSIQTDPNSTFEIVDIEGVPGIFQVVVTPQNAITAQCKLADPEKKIAKKSLDFYVTKAKDSSYATCIIYPDFAP